MALKKCKECGLMVSSEAQTCPHCGVKLRKSAWRKMWGAISIILCIVILVILYQTPISTQFKPNIEEWIKAEADKYAKETLKDTPISYKRIGGIRKDSRDKYTVVVVVDIHDYNDRVLMLEAQEFGDQVSIGWDTRSATMITLLKAGNELEQITW